MTFEEWHEQNFGPVIPGVPFHLPVLKRAYEAGATNRQWIDLDHIEIGNLWSEHKEVYSFGMALQKLLKERNS
jgi:hypothetical protein